MDFPSMRNISNSEVTCWLSCRRQYRYAHVLNLEPKETQVPLFRGGVGHEAFQRYTEARLDGNSHDKSMNWGMAVFTDALRSMPSMIDTILQTQMLFKKYMDYHKGWPEWRLLQPEQKFELAMTDDFKMVIRYDAMVEEIRSGKRLIGDYKFTYDFWSPEDHDLNGQMPKYIQVMNANGIKVDGGFLEEIRTRPLGEQKAADPRYTWRRTPYYPTQAKKINMIRQHIAASLEITEYRALPEQDQKAKSIPVLNKHGACKFCNFKSLCNSENDGKDITVDIQVDFKQNTYGYNFEEEVLKSL